MAASRSNDSQRAVSFDAQARRARIAMTALFTQCFWMAQMSVSRADDHVSLLSPPGESTLTLEPPPLEKPSFRVQAALLQMGVLVGLGVGWYEWKIEINKVDFDFARSVSGQWRRLTTGAGHRFDDNERYLNIGHPPMGAMYYQTARAYGAGMGASYLFNIGTSTFWEAVVEHREVVSLNDQIMTGIGGAPIGEALFRISDVFANGKPTVVNRTLALLTSPMRLGAWLSGESIATSNRYDSHNLDASVFHRFQIAMGGLSGPRGTTQWAALARGDFEVITLPGYEESPLAAEVELGDPSDTLHSARAGWLRGGEMSRLVLTYAADRSQFRTFELFARTTLFGQFETHAPRTTSVTGWLPNQRVFAAASAFELAYNAMPGLIDFLSFVHVIGPTADFRWTRSAWSVRAEISAYGDFSMIRPMAIGASVVPADWNAKSTLSGADKEYYYGWGGTASARIGVDYQRWRVGACGTWSHIESIDGLDRHQNAYVSPTGVAHDAVVDDSHLTDDYLNARIFVDSPIPFTSHLGVTVSGELIHRRGTWEAHQLRDQRSDRRLSLSLSYFL